MDNKLYLKSLYPKLISREISEEELKWLLEYFETNNLDDLYQMIRTELELPDQMVLSAPATAPEIQMGLDVYKRISAEIAKEQMVEPAIKKLWPRLAAAIAIAMVLFGGGLFYYSSQQHIAEYGNASVAGRNGATLTLADGKKIRLTDAANGELAKEAGISISKTADGQLVYEVKEITGKTDQVNVLSTAKGETYQVILPDGSKVWLNAATTLKFPVSFSATKERKVELMGEAYFEVAKDRQHPFIVGSKGQRVEVLGTHFNISCYEDEDATKTTLLEGSVRTNDTLLKPGQQSILRGAELKVVPVDIELAMDWKNGDFIFKGEDFKTTMRKIARWYDVDIVYDADLKENIELGGWVSRQSKLSEVLRRIELAGNVHFKVDGRRVLVTK
ncbi:fec operon regulator FecR [compost metagenome]|uniref:FecR family protein n=1 Tax=Pedobacter sp. ok626 TaxID=1761882 RepID=UPI000880AA1D|nr:FecR family protein [Pedobacter sp. ok626]SDL22878.1 FecR family protein [Pedobacter sp. ok626]